MRFGFGLRLLLIMISFAAGSQAVEPVTSQLQLPFNVVGVTWGGPQDEIDASSGDRSIPLKVTIQNISNLTATGVSARLALKSPFQNLTGGNQVDGFFASSIAPGSSATTQFVVNIRDDAVPGVYNLKMTINYLETNVGVGRTIYLLKTSDVDVPARIAATRYLVLYNVLTVPTEAPPAGNITVSASILNQGRLTAMNANATVLSTVLTRPSSVIVGQIDPNVPRPFSTVVQLRRNLTPGRYIITILVTYSDTIGVTHNQRLNIPIFVRQADTRPPPSTEVRKTLIDVIFEILRSLFRSFFGFGLVLPVAVRRVTRRDCSAL